MQDISNSRITLSTHPKPRQYAFTRLPSLTFCDQVPPFRLTRYPLNDLGHVLKCLPMLVSTAGPCHLPTMARSNLSKVRNILFFTSHHFCDAYFDTNGIPRSEYIMSICQTLSFSLV